MSQTRFTLFGVQFIRIFFVFWGKDLIQEGNEGNIL